MLLCRSEFSMVAWLLVSRFRLWLFTMILIGLALRLYNLTYHSLWFDEAISVHWARQTVPRILAVGFTLVEDRLPPLYYLMLKGWATLIDYSESSVRGLSVIFGVLLIPTISSVATLLFNRRVGLITAALVAFNPFLIWYSQEARMYASGAFFGVFAIWAFLQLCLSTNQRLSNNNSSPSAIRHSLPWVILFILAATAGLYNHLYVGFLLPALGLWLLISYPQRQQLWLVFAISGLIITLAFSPIALAIWRFSAESTPGNPFADLAQRAWWLLQSFTFWKASLTPILKIVIPTAFTLLIALAYLKIKSPITNTQRALRYQLSNSAIVKKYNTFNPKSQITRLSTHNQIPNPLLLVTLLLVFPFVIANVLLLRNQLAFFGARYFIIMTPWLLLLAAVGADNLSHWANQRIHRWSSVILFIFLFILTSLPIPTQWNISAAKEAWRQSANYLAQQAAPTDGILIHPDWVRYPFQYYFQGSAQTYAAFSNVTNNTPLDGPLQGVVDDHTVIWLIQSHLDGPDPNRLVEQWLATRYPLVTELYPPGITIKGYATGYQLDALPAGATPVDFQFENGMRLVGYDADKLATATDELFHPPSGWVHVTLYWTTDHPIIINATPYVYLVGSEGIWGVSLERSNDSLKFYPPSQWFANKTNDFYLPIIRHDIDVNLNPLTPTGTYKLLVGLQGFETQYTLTEIEIRKNTD